nr:MAG TPA: hypothetical protein [Caudoviricetes sp.]
MYCSMSSPFFKFFSISPGLLSYGLRGRSLDYGGIITHYSVFVKPLFSFFSGARFFFYSVFYTHILAIMYAI